MGHTHDKNPKGTRGKMGVFLVGYVQMIDCLFRNNNSKCRYIYLQTRCAVLQPDHVRIDRTDVSGKW